MKEATITLGLPLLSQSASTNSNFATETSPKFHLKNIPPLLSSLSHFLHLIMWLFYMIHNCPVITATLRQLNCAEKQSAYQRSYLPLPDIYLVILSSMKLGLLK